MGRRGTSGPGGRRHDGLRAGRPARASRPPARPTHAPSDPLTHRRAAFLGLLVALAVPLARGGAAQEAPRPSRDEVVRTWAARVAALETPAVRRRIAAVNVGGTAALVLGRGVVEGGVRTVGDGAEALVWGAASGAAFYGAKVAAGRGRPALGYGVAVVAASVAENAAGDAGPLSHLRLPLGPVDLRLRTPLARPRPSGARGGAEAVAVELDPLALVATVAVPLSGGRPRLRRGVPVWEFDDLGGRPGYTRRGRTMGRTVLVEADAPRPVLAHETIHRIQGMQTAAVTPFGTLGAIVPGAHTTAFDGDLAADVRAEWLYGVQVALWLSLFDYLDRWPEVEARALDEPPKDGNGE